MRALALSLALLFHLGVSSQGLVINEVQAACRNTIRTDDGRSPDWIELYNPLRHSVPLQGLRLSLRDRTHVFEQPLSVPSKGHLLLYADERPNEGAQHVGFKLDRTGGTLLLIDRDGTTILDVFTFPKMTTDLSVGRVPDGASTWSYFTAPSPKGTNTRPQGGIVTVMAPQAEAVISHGKDPHTISIRLNAPEGCTVRYTLDGTYSHASTALTADGPIMVERTTTLRATCHCPGQLDGAEWVRTFTVGTMGPLGIALTLDPEDLWDPRTGIYVDGLSGNYSKSGDAWERSGHIEIAQRAAFPVGVRISGSGSRGRPKRSFKLYARDRYASPDSTWTMADGTHCDELILRADATPHATLHNLFLEAVVQRFGLALEVQPSELVPVHLNGVFWGHYRSMPPKDAQWLTQRSGAAAVDMVDGPAHAALSGSNDHFLRARQHLLDRSSMDSIAAYLDLTSLYDLAAMDLYMGRADHDLNVRAYRPRVPGGRWRWVLFDMDLWADVEDPSVQRMNTAGQPESPFLTQLLSNPALEIPFLARITALNATALHPEHTVPLVDSLYLVHAEALQQDRTRWSTEMEVPDPAVTASELVQFAKRRGEHLMEQLSAHTGRSLERVRLDIPQAHQGRVLIEGLPVPPGKQELHLLKGIPMRISIRPATGYEGLLNGKVILEDGVRLDDASRSGPIRIRFSATAP